MHCRNCGEEMTNVHLRAGTDRISYDICESCGSFWLDAGELDKMAFQVEGSIEYCSQERADAPGERRKACPRCEGEYLVKVRFIGQDDVTLDRCRNCGGFWLDGGELGLVNRQLESVMPVQGKGFSEFVNETHLPFWHKRVKRPSGETDFGVAVPPMRGAVLKSETPSSCPACEAALNTYAAFGIEIDGCPRCRGVWLDADEIRKLKDRAEEGSWRTLRWMDDEVEAIEKATGLPSRRRCPRCADTALVTASFGGSGIMIDTCPSCRGTWLDHGEFEDIVERLAAELDALSPDEMRREVYGEIKEIWSGPEGAVSEIRDAKAAISALVSITIFARPKLHALVRSVATAGRAGGLG